MTTRDLTKASRTTIRTAKYEWTLDEAVLDAVMESRTIREMRKHLVEVLNSNEYDKLPTYRQVAVQAYFRGAADAMARAANPDAPMHPFLPPPPPKPKRFKGDQKRRAKSEPPPIMAPTWLVELEPTGT